MGEMKIYDFQRLYILALSGRLRSFPDTSTPRYPHTNSSIPFIPVEISWFFI